MGKRKGIRQELAQLAPSGPVLEQQLQSLMAQKKYPQAIRKLQQSLKRDPDQTLKITEADIWLQQGQDALERQRYKQAEISLKKAFDLQQNNDTYYWLAKCDLAQEHSAKALALFQSAFDEKTLPKDLGGCYFKLLFINGQADVVKQLIDNQAKRFYAPQLHWARGVLALQANEQDAALSHFKKMGRLASPGDKLSVWPAYIYQQTGEWERAETALGIGMELPRLGSSGLFGGMALRASMPQHAAAQRLTMVQAAQTKRSFAQFFDFDDTNFFHQELVLVLELLRLICAKDYHDAAHVFLKLNRENINTYPDLKSLHRPLMILAGEQAANQEELTCSATFWRRVVDEPEFDANLALHLHRALDDIGAYRDAQQVLNQLMQWVQQVAKQNPQTWPQKRLNSTLATLHCWVADSQIALGRSRDAERSVRQAEKLAPDHAEVLGRRGLSSVAKGKIPPAIPLLTQALEKGCEFEEVYQVLVECLKHERGDVKSIRRQFGKRFGDISVETEVEVPAWVEALTFQSYRMLEEFVETKEKLTPPLDALQIFLESAYGQPSSSQKITLNQEKAVPQWDALLRSHPPAQQVEILKAIYLTIQQHAKRNKKGIAALQSRYFQQIVQLKAEVPEAKVAHLMLLPMTNLTSERLDMAVESALNRAVQPSTLLAQAQLEMRRFCFNRRFAPFIEKQLKQDPQNPLLLLAKATLHARNSQEYQTFYEQGFELARRLQDGAALQAYREEDWFKAQEMTRRAVGPQFERVLADPSQLDMVDMIQRMAKAKFGMEVPLEVLAQMVPELAAMMQAELGGDDMFDDDIDASFLPPPPPNRSRRSSRRRRSQ